MFLSSRAYNPGFDEIPDYDYAKLWFEEKNIPQLIIGSLVRFF